MSSTSSTANAAEKPERSRNAKAQARHRAKRKAYIEQLEQTVTKLQAALGYSPEQVSALPPSSITIRELQQDNNRLQKENEELRRVLNDMQGGGRRSSMAPYPDPRGCDRDYKRRKMSSHIDSVYMNASDSHHGERPPPLTIPHYGNGVSSNNSSNGSLFNMHTSSFQMPNTPSGSSATSSPPFSPIMQHPLDQRPPGNLNGSSLPSYSHNHGYTPSGVKVEDDSYGHSNGHHSGSYSTYSNQSNGSMEWHSYSSERAHLHR